ncbi:hypothetical protein BU24DRAFT_496952 [Aaosphaeria arxii CBS 175.79]|uniref:Uncharacterized protein n=1 Tax=Aaosphaeria arxii CBS 175.79 TaxID=1450172 RepID=A0A6A5XBM9_9PLEO|nr:uncharacterized protein BU24DRAFT_496952 [Aaosphaeria arxii CBS 175.79]KAF2010184.1 hypothetical protein BU24DRAFT_496952 [Aaosphaeria arxii CBS 175.79]
MAKPTIDPPNGTRQAGTIPRPSRNVSPNKELLRRKAQITDLQTRLKNMQIKDKKQVEQIKRLETEVKATKDNSTERSSRASIRAKSAENADLKAEVVRLKKENKELTEIVKTTIPHLEIKTEQQTLQLRDLENENAELRDMVFDGEDMYEDLRKEHEDLKKELEQFKAKHPVHETNRLLQKAEEQYVHQLLVQNNALDSQLCDAVRECTFKDIQIINLTCDREALREELKAFTDEPIELPGDALKDNRSDSGSTIVSSAFDDDVSYDSDATIDVPMPDVESCDPPTVIITISPEHVKEKNPKLLNRLLDSIDSTSSIDIRGPVDLVAAIRENLEKKRSEVGDLVKEARRLEDALRESNSRPLCEDPSHVSIKDTITAFKTQLTMCKALIRQHEAKRGMSPLDPEVNLSTY